MYFQIQEPPSGFSCTICNKICKSKGGLTLHVRRKHSEASGTGANYDKLARDTLTCAVLSTIIEEAKQNVLESGVYTQELTAFLSKSGAYACTEEKELYQEMVELLKLVIKKGDAERFYEQFYGSIVLRSAVLLENLYPDELCKVLLSTAADKILALSKSVGKTSTYSCPPVSIKDAERGPLAYLTGYVIRNLHQKCRRMAKKGQISLENEEFLSFLNTLHIEKEKAAGNEYNFIKEKDRGGLWYPKEQLLQITLTAEMNFRMATGKEKPSHKIHCNKIVDQLLKDVNLKSNWNVLLEESGVEFMKAKANVILDQLLSLYVKIRSFSYSKDIVQKYKIEQKRAKQRALRKELKK